MKQCGQLVKQNIGSKETAMPTRRFERIILAQLLVGGCAVVFGLIEHAQAQPVNIPHAPPPPVVNPSSPNIVPQPSYTPPTPSTRSTTPSTPTTVPSGEVRSPAREEPSSTTTRSERTSVPKTRSVHHHHGGRSIGVGLYTGVFLLPLRLVCSYLSSVCLLPARWLVSPLRRGGLRPT